VEGAFLKTEPDVGVEFAGFFEGVFGEIEDEDLGRRFEDAVGFFDGGGCGCWAWWRAWRRMAEAHRCVGEWDAFDVAKF